MHGNYGKADIRQLLHLAFVGLNARSACLLSEAEQAILVYLWMLWMFLWLVTKTQTVDYIIPNGYD